MNPEDRSLLRDVTVLDAADFDPRRWWNELREGHDCESDFVLGLAPVAAKNQTRFFVRRSGGKIVFCALLFLDNKDLFNGDDPGRAPGYRGSIRLDFNLHGYATGCLSVHFAANSAPGFSSAIADEDAATTRTPVPRPLRWRFSISRNNAGCGFESEEVFFYATFRERDLFAQSASIGFNLLRTDCDAREVSSWSFAPGVWEIAGRLLRHAGAGLSRKPIPVAARAKTFRVAVTNDPLMVLRNLPYTPERLDAEMAALRGWGAARLHWIDNEGYPAPAGTNYAKSVRECGELLPAASRAAHARGLEIFADLKLYDLSFPTEPGLRLRRACLPVFDGAVCLPFDREMLRHDEIFLARNPAWNREPVFPLVRLCLYSLDPLPQLSPADIEIQESADNLDYRPIARRGWKVAVERISRQHLRWTPAGVLPDRGRMTCWRIEIDGLRICHPFVAVAVKGKDLSLVNRQFAAIEAVAAGGARAPFIVGRPVGGRMPFEPAGPAAPARRFSFSAAGMLSGGDEPATSLQRISLDPLGIAFAEPDSIPGMLEPGSPAARGIWLARIGRLLDAGVDGVGIRTLRHHRGCNSWTQFSYAGPVLRAFQQRHGRAPDPGWEDIERIRHLRGEGFTDLLREASRMVRGAGARLAFQIELAGGSLDAVYSRMGFHFHLRQWLEEGLLDEIHARPFSPHSPWLRSVLLPAAKQHGVGLHVVTPNAAAGYGHSDLLQVAHAARAARELGFDGFNLYEAANLYELSGSGAVRARGLGRECIAAAAGLTKLPQE